MFLRVYFYPQPASIQFMFYTVGLINLYFTMFRLENKIEDKDTLVRRYEYIDHLQYTHTKERVVNTCQHTCTLLWINNVLRVCVSVCLRESESLEHILRETDRASYPRGEVD